MSTASEHATQQRPTVLVVGAGFGGLAVAEGLRDVNADVHLLDQRNHHLFQPMMYQVAMAQLRTSDIATPLRELFDGDDSVQPVMDTVDDVDLEAKRLHCRSGRQLAWDILVLATGARYQYLGHPEWQRHVLPLKNLNNAMHLRERVFGALEVADRTENVDERRAQLTFVVVGAGSTGVELAGAMGRLLPGIVGKRFPRLDANDLRIVLIDPEARPLSAMQKRLGVYAGNRLSALGVQLRMETAVEDISSGRVRLDDGSDINTATIIWAAGVEGHGAGDWLPDDLVDDSNRVMVRRDLSIPGHPDVYVIGDAAAARNADGNPYPGLAAVAKQQGAHVARLILARVEQRDADAHAPFHYVDYGSMAMIGNGRAVAEIRGRHIKGFKAWLLWGAVHLYFLVDTRNRLLVLGSWFWAMLSGKRQRVTLGASPPTF